MRKKSPIVENGLNLTGAPPLVASVKHVFNHITMINVGILTPFLNSGWRTPIMAVNSCSSLNTSNARTTDERSQAAMALASLGGLDFQHSAAAPPFVTAKYREYGSLNQYRDQSGYFGYEIDGRYNGKQWADGENY